jgi:CheY-like chemotaxis protein
LPKRAKQALVALEEAESNGTPYSLVLLDSQMPETDGFTLARSIKDNPQFMNIPMIMLTSCGMRGDGLRCRQLGIGGYLSKPVNWDVAMGSQTLKILRLWRRKFILLSTSLRP